MFTPGLSYNDRHPSWRINRLQLIDPYGWHKLTFEEVSEIQSKLSNFERMTWNDIFVAAKNRNHSVLVSGLKCPKARRWMKTNMPDQDELWSLHLTGVERIWGVFAEGVLNLIFWDPLHLIWETER